MKKTFSIIMASFSLLLFSCQKEFTLDIPVETQPGTTGDFTGSWKFIHSTASTLSVNEISDGTVVTKTVTTSNYTTENNTGTIVFTNQTMAYNNIGYSMTIIAKGLIYEDGVLVDSVSMPIQTTLAPITAQLTFTRVGADSLTYAPGTALPGGIQPTGPAGVKLKMEQDKLYITQRVSESGTSVVQGLTVKELKQANVVTLLQRQ